ncbi:hypothetical protein ACTHOQ_14350 [Solibacillus silvestris]|uniref:hypothetical protein n=1 Tax=Solibacillus silvestris TaxID=76853 RepID=UPI003F7F920D
MQPLIKKIEALVISISVQNGIGIIEAISEKDESKKAIFRITAETPLMTKDAHQIGVSAIPVKGKIIAFVDSKSPLPMISPPHIIPLLVIFDQYAKKGEVCVGAFDRMLYSEQLKLKLHVNEATEIVDLAGKRVDQNDLAGKMLFVFYDRATRSMPAQTNPAKIIATNIMQTE